MIESPVQNEKTSNSIIITPSVKQPTSMVYYYVIYIYIYIYTLKQRDCQYQNCNNWWYVNQLQTGEHELLA